MSITTSTLTVYTEVPPMEYWRVLAEKRKDALAETLKENEEVCWN